MMNKDAYWFKHDSNAKDDPKCIILIEELGLEGYGIFWILIETLRDQPELEADLRILPALARRYNTSFEKVKAVVYRYDLFEIEDDKFFFSPSLKKRMIPLIEKKKKLIEAGKKGANKRWNKGKNREANGVANKEPNSNKRREEKNREEKKKKNGKQVASVPPLSDVQDYFKEKGYDTQLANKFYEYYNEPMKDRNGRVWKDQNGKTVKSWKQKALAVWMKDDNKKDQSGQVFDGGTW
jgi:hypothetical protein